MVHALPGSVGSRPLQAPKPSARPASALRPARHAPQLRRPLQVVRAAASQNLTKLDINADELLQTVLLTQSGKNGAITVKEIVEGSSAAKAGLQTGAVLKAVSDPAAPGNLWEVEARSNLRHVLEQWRMQQSASVILEFAPPGSEPEGDRLGRDQEERFSKPDEGMLQRRAEQRSAYLSKKGTYNQSNWVALAGGAFILPTILILGYAIFSGYIDSLGGQL